MDRVLRQTINDADHGHSDTPSASESEGRPVSKTGKKTSESDSDSDRTLTQTFKSPVSVAEDRVASEPTPVVDNLSDNQESSPDRKKVKTHHNSLVTVRKTRLQQPEKGLFAIAEIPEGTSFLDYAGQQITLKQLSQIRDSRKIYVMALPGGRDFILPTRKSVSRHINAPGPNDTPNVRFTAAGPTQNLLYLTATTNIAPGTQLLAQYPHSEHLPTFNPINLTDSCQPTIKSYLNKQ